MPEHRVGKSHRAVFREDIEQDERLLIAASIDRYDDSVESLSNADSFFLALMQHASCFAKKTAPWPPTFGLDGRTRPILAVAGTITGDLPGQYRAAEDRPHSSGRNISAS